MSTGVQKWATCAPRSTHEARGQQATATGTGEQPAREPHAPTGNLKPNLDTCCADGDRIESTRRDATHKSTETGTGTEAEEEAEELDWAY